jgi:hypothetical protein
LIRSKVRKEHIKVLHEGYLTSRIDEEKQDVRKPLRDPPPIPERTRTNKEKGHKHTK